ncbi:helix-turn-helix transcriptional regulator [Streptomyces clavifer]|uniref:helix-turn-helix transcriptional regulator n=1 Tax=Streptomyces clavifer TaxID=68188 RepID=UPI0038194D01
MKDQIREFLTSRRAKVTPAQAGIAWAGGDRRVPGLRREEVAELAGVSTDYYTRLEQGKIRGASDSVLNAVARALKLTDAEREHLFSLIRTPASTSQALRGQDQITSTVRPSVRRVLDGMQTPTVVFNARQDLLAANVSGRAMFSPHFACDRPNIARFIFLDPRAQNFYNEWELACCYSAAMLRLEVGRDPLNPELTAFVGELSTRSPQFRLDWSDQHVYEHQTGRKVFHHPEVGELDVNYDVFQLPGEASTWMTAYTADVRSPTQEKLSLLASWTIELDASEPVGNKRPTRN